MADSEEILLHSLSTSGVPIPDGVSSVHDLNPDTLFSISSHALRLIDDDDSTHYPASLPPDSMPDRIRLCSQFASAFNSKGFKPPLSFHKFLYPSKEDLYKLVRFLVTKVSESRTDASISEKNAEKEKLGQSEEISAKLKDQESDCAVAENDLGLNRCSLDDHLLQGESLTKSAFTHQHGSQNHDVFEEPIAPEYFDFQHLDDLEIFREAAELVFGGEHPVEYYIEQLNDKVEAKRQRMKKMASECGAIVKPLQEQQSLSQPNPGLSEKLVGITEMELEIKYLTAEIKRRDEELSKLSSDLEKQPKHQAPRRFYIEQINEITKNSRKQDNDIQRILKDTRELQLESNTIQERLNRTYAVVNETIFREAKKDEVARQAYKLVTDIHESFEQIGEKILAADRTRRDAAEYEAKLAIIGGRSFNVDKLQQDVDAIRRENDILEHSLKKL